MWPLLRTAFPSSWATCWDTGTCIYTAGRSVSDSSLPFKVFETLMTEAQWWYSICMESDTLTKSDGYVQVSLWEDRTRPDIKPKDFLFRKDRKSEAAATAGRTCRYYEAACVQPNSLFTSCCSAPCRFFLIVFSLLPHVCDCAVKFFGITSAGRPHSAACKRTRLSSLSGSPSGPGT